MLPAPLDALGELRDALTELAQRATDELPSSTVNLLPFALDERIYQRSVI